jgi:ferric-dicitrate binding protein FerR (iron transport regulator)
VKAAVRSALVAVATFLLAIELASAQTGAGSCSTANVTGAAQTSRCQGGITIVAENGARYTLSDINHDGRLDSVELSSKALLIEVPKGGGRKKFQVSTPQAVAAVRGTKWAVDAAEEKTSVFVVDGRVAVARRTPGQKQRVVLGPGEGVDVESTATLTVKRWAPARVAALMARLGQ